MKEQHVFAAGGMSAEKHKAAMQKATQKIPAAGGRQIDELIQDRPYSAPGDCQMSVVGCGSSTPAEVTLQLCQKKWGSDPKTMDWLVTVSPILPFDFKTL
jgi:hypothetical protein